MSNSKIYHVIQIAILVAIMVILSYVRIPVGPVPIVLENFGVTLAALLLGIGRGTVAVVVFIVIRILGIGGPGGLALLASPVSGYVYGWLLMPACINLLMKTFRTKHWFSQFVIIAIASVILDDFVCGGIGLTVFNHVSIVGSLLYNGSFVVGDLIKSLIAAILYTQVVKSVSFRHLLV